MDPEHDIFALHSVFSQYKCTSAQAAWTAALELLQSYKLREFIGACRTKDLIDAILDAR